KFTSPGFAITPAPELPKKLPAAISALLGTANAAGLIQLYGCGAAPCEGSPTIFGRLLVVVLPKEKLSEGVARVPPWSVAIPVSSHPSTIWFTAAGTLENRGLPFPNGRSQTPEKTKWFLTSKLRGPYESLRL